MSTNISPTAVNYIHRVYGVLSRYKLNNDFRIVQFETLTQKNMIKYKKKKKLEKETLETFLVD